MISKMQEGWSKVHNAAREMVTVFFVTIFCSSSLSNGHPPSEKCHGTSLIAVQAIASFTGVCYVHWKLSGVRLSACEFLSF